MNKMNSRIQNMSKETVSIATHAGLNVGIMALLDVNHGVRPEAAIIGVGGIILGDYADGLISPMLGSYRVYIYSKLIINSISKLNTSKLLY